MTFVGHNLTASQNKSFKKGLIYACSDVFLILNIVRVNDLFKSSRKKIDCWGNPRKSGLEGHGCCIK